MAGVVITPPWPPGSNHPSYEAELTALVEQLAQRLLALGWRLSTAESCTGGLIAAACTALAGSSAWYERGSVSYSNAAKAQMLGVDAALIARYGAVSEPVARAMAWGAVQTAQVALAVTGVAGPGGGSADKPVGTVWFAWAVPDAAGAQPMAPKRPQPPQLHSAVQHFAGDRTAVRQATVCHSLRGMLALLPTPPWPTCAPESAPSQLPPQQRSAAR